jgi:hypothetical protein
MSQMVEGGMYCSPRWKKATVAFSCRVAIAANKANPESGSDWQEISEKRLRQTAEHLLQSPVSVMWITPTRDVMGGTKH